MASTQPQVLRHTSECRPANLENAKIDTRQAIPMSYQAGITTHSSAAKTDISTPKHPGGKLFCHIFQPNKNGLRSPICFKKNEKNPDPNEYDETCAVLLDEFGEDEGTNGQIVSALAVTSQYGGILLMCIDETKRCQLVHVAQPNLDEVDCDVTLQHFNDNGKELYRFSMPKEELFIDLPAQPESVMKVWPHLVRCKILPSQTNEDYIGDLTMLFDKLLKYIPNPAVLIVEEPAYLQDDSTKSRHIKAVLEDDEKMFPLDPEDNTKSVLVINHNLCRWEVVPDAPNRTSNQLKEMIIARHYPDPPNGGIKCCFLDEVPNDDSLGEFLVRQFEERDLYCEPQICYSLSTCCDFCGSPRLDLKVSECGKLACVVCDSENKKCKCCERGLSNILKFQRHPTDKPVMEVVVQRILEKHRFQDDAYIHDAELKSTFMHLHSPEPFVPEERFIERDALFQDEI